MNIQMWNKLKEKVETSKTYFDDNRIAIHTLNLVKQYMYDLELENEVKQTKIKQKRGLIMTLTKEQFVKHLNEIKKMQDIEDKIREATKDLDFTNITFMEYENIAVNILKDACQDTSEWIEYFLYETEFGKRDMCVSFNDEKVKLDTVEDLYDFMVEYYLYECARDDFFNSSNY